MFNAQLHSFWTSLQAVLQNLLMSCDVKCSLCLNAYRKYSCACAKKKKKNYVRKTNSSTGALSCSVDSFTLESDFSSPWLVWDYTYILNRHLCAYICACISICSCCDAGPVSQRERKDRAEPPHRRLQTSLNLPISLQAQDQIEIFSGVSQDESGRHWRILPFSTPPAAAL